METKTASAHVSNTMRLPVVVQRLEVVASACFSLTTPGVPPKPAGMPRGRSRRTRRARAAWSLLREAAHVIRSVGVQGIDLETPEYHHVSPHRSPAPQGGARRRATFRRHRRGTAVVAEGARAPVRDARLRGRRRGDAEAPGPRRCHAARRGQAGGAGRLDRRHGRRPQGSSRQEESDRRRRKRRTRPNRDLERRPRPPGSRAPPSSSSTTSCRLASSATSSARPRPRRSWIARA